MCIRDSINAEYMGIRNMINDQILKNVSIELQLKDTSFQLLSEKPATKIEYSQIDYAYLILSYNFSENPYPTKTLKAKMKFTSVEIDPSSKEKIELGSFEDEYALPEIVFSAKDYVKGIELNLKEYEEQLKALKSSKSVAENSQNYQIAYKSLEEAVKALSIFFGLSAVKGSEQVQLGAKMHTMQLAGNVPNEGLIFALLKIKMGGKYGCVLSLNVCASNKDLCNLILASVGQQI
eukprot:TRINITY_DN2907_c0_g1_i1.p1 TRINITY_DN2907_c0_g1~~TRINITY_DN2907_c0_g1_i1.p1  ORF type:complete len:235 (+),score=46.20 TRINITY_DN2907_c0_g1_i1:147-851(+)